MWETAGQKTATTEALKAGEAAAARRVRRKDVLSFPSREGRGRKKRKYRAGVGTVTLQNHSSSAVIARPNNRWRGTEVAPEGS